MPLAKFAVAEPVELDGRDLTIPAPGFRLERGGTLAEDVVSVRLHGPEDAPLVVVAGGISASRFVYRDDGSGWWQASVAPGAGVDLEHWRVLAFDFAPGRGFAEITTGDQARLVALALDALGVEQVHAWVGASYGGMAGLAFAGLFPERLGRLCAISAAHRPSQTGVALRGVQRRIVELAADCGRAEDGLSLARQLAMVTYRSPAELAARFDGEPDAEGLSDVCRYLVARGESFGRTAAAERWRALSLSIDRHRTEPEAVAVPTTLVASSSDWLTPTCDMRELAARLPALRRFVEIPSVYGHDAFLKEASRLNPILSDFLTGETR